MIRILAVAAMVSAFAAPSFAAPFNDGPWEAVPQAPTKETGFIGGHVIWSCDPMDCKSVNDTSLATGMDACEAAAKELGVLKKFVADRGPFNASKLTKCNASAPTTQAAR